MVSVALPNNKKEFPASLPFWEMDGVRPKKWLDNNPTIFIFRLFNSLPSEGLREAFYAHWQIIPPISISVTAQ